MPLNKSGSKEAFSDNVAAERHAGKPEAQALAIAYSVEREHESNHAERHEHEKRKYRD